MAPLGILYDRDTENSARMPKYAKDDGKISAPDERLIIAVPGSKACLELGLPESEPSPS